MIRSSFHGPKDFDRKPIMRSTGILIVALTLAGAALAPARAQDVPTGRVDWLTDYAIALEEAALTRRPVLLTFYTSWCGWCRKLEGSTFQAPEFVNLSQHVIPVRVNGDKDPALRGVFRVTGYPTTLLISRQGRALTRINGYLPPGPFVDRLIQGMDRRESLEPAKAGVEERPEDPTAWYALGDVLLALQRYDAARDAFRTVIELGRGDGSDLVDDSRLDIALSYLFSFKPSEAIPLLEEFLEAHPDSDRRDQGLFFYGVALVHSGQTDQGLDKIDEAAAITSLDYIKFEARRLRAVTREGQGQG